MPAGLLERLMGVSAGNPADERYWSTSGWGPMSTAGVRVSDAAALKISTWYAIVAKWGDVIGSLPLITYTKQRDGGKKRAGGLRLYRLLHDQPNFWQTSIEWRSLGMNHIFHRGNFYNEIVLDERGFPDMVLPLHPDRVKAKLGASGRREYEVLRDDGVSYRRLEPGRMFHVPGRVMRNDGVTGLAVLDAARESLGLAVANQQYLTTTLRENQLPAGTLSHPGVLQKPTMDAMRDEWYALHGPGASRRNIAILQEGVSFTPMTLTNEQMQTLELSHFSVADLARFGDIPLMMLQETEKSTSWGTGIEQFQIAFVVHSVRPWCVRWEQAIARDLIVNNDFVFAEFLLDGLLRGDAKSRNEAFQIMRQNGILNSDEWRTIENLNPIGGEIGSTYWRPANMVPADTPVGQIGGGQRTSGASAQLRLIMDEACARLVRKETVAIAKNAVKFAADDEGWQGWVTTFYHGFGADLMRDLRLGVTDARSYCEQHAEVVITEGANAAQLHEDDWIAALVKLALGESDEEQQQVRRVKRTVERDDAGRIASVVEEETVDAAH